MTGSQAWFASAAVNLIGMSAERFTRDDFAQLLARTCAQACAGSEVGVVLVGKPTVTVGSTLHAGALEALGLRLGEGAAVDALRTRATVPEADLAEAALAEAGLDDKRWPSYAPAARQLGYQTVRSFTLLHAAEPVGVIDVFRPASAAAPAADLLQALADLAAAHITRESALQAASARADQLEGALASRVLIEQAKGMIAERFGVPMESAFGSLRRHARDHNERLSDLCASVTSGETDLAAIQVDFFAMSASRRAQLRDRAIGRWRQVSSEALAQRERAQSIISKSVELRVEVDHIRAQHEIQAMGRAIDRHFRQMPRGGPRGDDRPRVLIGATDESVRSFVTGALRNQARLALVDEGLSNADLLGSSIVEQPDVVILGSDLAGAPGDDLVAQLRRYCPDSRRLVVVGQPGDVPALASRADAVVVCGDTPALVNCALELCGLRAHVSAADGRPGASEVNGAGV